MAAGACAAHACHGHAHMHVHARTRRQPLCLLGPSARSSMVVRAGTAGGTAGPPSGGEGDAGSSSSNTPAQPAPAPVTSISSAQQPAPAASASASTSQQPLSLEERLAELCARITSLFPVWVVLAAAAALYDPSLFTWFPKGAITAALAATMLGMGLTMKLSDFATVFTTMPQLLLLGMALQYTVMPALGYAYSRYGGLSAPLAIGMIILSACPGGTASNIVAYIARGEMALSIMMTTASTLGAVVATPLITAALAGTLVPVDAKGLFMSTLQVVLAPVALGCLANQAFPAAVSRIARFTPCVAALLVALIVGSTLAHSAGAAKASGAQLLRAVAGLHASGFALGYVVSRALGLSEKICRTNSIEVGMQNSTLGAVLAAVHFSNPLTAAPCAVSACTHSVMGSLLAAYWRYKDDKEAAAAQLQAQR